MDYFFPLFKRLCILQIDTIVYKNIYVQRDGAQGKENIKKDKEEAKYTCDVNCKFYVENKKHFIGSFNKRPRCRFYVAKKLMAGSNGKRSKCDSLDVLTRQQTHPVHRYYIGTY